MPRNPPRRESALAQADNPAREAWRRMFDLVSARYRALETGALDRLDLTPPLARLLQNLKEDEGTPMARLAGVLQCDASNVTWLVDKLAALGAVERRPAESDGRVKLVHLTPLGRRRRREVFEAIYAPPEEFLAADAASLRRLLEIFSELSPPVERSRLEDRVPPAKRPSR